MSEETIVPRTHEHDQSEPHAHPTRHHYHTKEATSQEERVESNTRSVAGIFLIALGAYFLLDNLNVFNINLARIVTTWWPLILVYFGFEQVAKNRPAIRTVWYIILIAAVAYIIMSGLFS